MPSSREATPWHGDDRRQSYVKATPARDSVGYPDDAHPRADERTAAGERECGRTDPDGGGCDDRACLNRRADLE